MKLGCGSVQITCPASVPRLRPQHCRIENAVDRYASWDCLEKPCICDSGMTRARVGVEAAVACGLSSAFPEPCEPAQDDCPGGRCGSGWTVCGIHYLEVS